MTYRTLLNANVGYKLSENHNAVDIRKSPVLSIRTFAEIVEQFHPDDVDDCGLYLRMKDAYEHSKTELDIFAEKSLNVPMKKRLLTILFERESLLNSMNLIKFESKDKQKIKKMPKNLLSLQLAVGYSPQIFLLSAIGIFCLSKFAASWGGIKPKFENKLE